MLCRSLALALGLCLSGTPALAAWTAPVIVTNGSGQAGAATTAQTGNVTIAQNHLIVVTGQVHGSTLSSVTDAVGNTYTGPSPCQRGVNSDYGFVYYAVATTGLSAQKITVTAAGSAAIAFSVWDVVGYDPVVIEDTGARNCAFNNSATTSPAVTSGTPTYSGDLFFSAWASIGSAASFTAGGSWLPSGGWGTGNTSIILLADYLDATGSGAPQTNNPTTSSKVYSMPITAFKAAAAGGTTVQNLGLLGVGN